MIWLSQLFLLTIWSTLGTCVKIVYRADTRSPQEIESQGGFWCMAASYQLAPSYSLYKHVGGEDGMQASNDDGFISTTKEKTVAPQFLPGGTGYVYKISAIETFIDVEGSFGSLYHLFNDEAEVSAMYKIPWSLVIGWTRYENGQAKETGTNPSYQRNTANREDGGDQPQFAGFPFNHQAWDMRPWSKLERASSRHQDGSGAPSVQALAEFAAEYFEDIGMNPQNL